MNKAEIQKDTPPILFGGKKGNEMLNENDIIEYAVLVKMNTKHGEDWYQVVLTEEQQKFTEALVLSGRSIKLHERSIRDKAYDEIVSGMIGG